MATERQSNYQIAVRVQALIDAEDLDTPERPHYDDDYWAAAEMMLAAEAQGRTMRYNMIVVLKEVTSSPMDSGRYIYAAFQAKHAPGAKGCAHPVDAVSLGAAASAAIRLHEHDCVGRR